MDWPTLPLEERPSSDFIPDFCPRSDCPQHHPNRCRPLRFHRHGVFLRADGRAVPRFRCRACRRTFSLQSFAFSYYLKRPRLSVPIAAGLLAGSAHRQIARSIGCSPSTVTRRSARLGRHSLLLSSLALQHVPRLTEPAVIDHFESFAISQDDPVGVATAVGQRSWFVYGLDPAPHRRTGRQTPAQRQRARNRRRLPRGTYVSSFTRILDLLAARAPVDRPLDLVTDDHPAYRIALARHGLRHRFRRRVYANPPRGPKGSPRSRAAVRRDREMFAVDLLHGLIRHSCAHHRRETIAFSRRLNALLERGFLLAVWRNFVKTRSERRSGEATPAMVLGLARCQWEWPRVLARRLFPSKIPLPPAWRKIYRREWETTVVAPGSRHQLKYAV